MKTIALFLVSALLTFNAFAENDTYVKAMTAAKEALNTANSPDEYLAAANQFERIANVEKTEWLPNYYAAYAMTFRAASEKDPAKKDEGLDAAQKLLEQSAAVDHDKSEVLALQGFIYMLKIGVDPAARGPQFSGMSAAALQKAKAINPDNPRALYLLAQLSFGTAQFFGSGTSEACGLNEQALEKFKAVDNNEKKDQLAPDWGLQMSERFKASCEG